MKFHVEEAFRAFTWTGDLFEKSKEYKELFFDESGTFVGDMRFGVYYSDFLWVRSLPEDQNKLWETIPEDDFQSIAAFIGIDFQKSKASRSAMFYEAIARLCDVFYRNSFYCIKNSRSTKKKDKIYKLICGGDNETGIEKIDPNRCMKYLSKRLREVNLLLEDSYRSVDAELLYRLKGLIEMYGADSKLCHQYISGNRSGHDRCVAAYFFEEEIADSKGYISFSGYHDCPTKSLADGIQGQPIKTAFTEILNQVSKALKLTLVQTNENICKHGIVDQRLEVVTTLEAELRRQKSKNDFGQDFACCERKIFTKFYPTHVKGCLHIKKEPCPLCELGILYERKKKHCFGVRSYLFI